MSLGASFLCCSSRVGLLSSRVGLSPSRVGLFGRQTLRRVQTTTVASEAKQAELSHVVYEHYRPWHFRALSAFAASQVLYWSYLSYENLTGTGPVAPKPTPPVINGEAGKTKLEESLVVKFYTHPAWCVLGAFVSVACSWMLRFYARALVSQIVYYPKSYVTEIYTHTALGGRAGPKRVPVLNMQVETSKQSGFLMLDVTGQKWKYLVDRSGSFQPILDAGESKEEKEASVLRSLGLSDPMRRDSQSSNSMSNSKDKKHPPSIQELRQRRISLTRHR